MPQHICERADVDAGQVLVTGRVIEHGHSSLLHDAVWSQIDELKRVEVHEGNLLVVCTVPWPLGACGTQCTVEEELRTRILHQVVPLQVKISCDVE